MLLPWSPASNAAPLSKDTTAMALTGVPAPTYPTPQESHSPEPCSPVSHCPGDPAPTGVLLHGDPVSLGSNSHRGPAPMEVPAHPCLCICAVLLYVHAVCPSVHPCALTLHIRVCISLLSSRTSVPPCGTCLSVCADLCARCQPVCQHLTHPSNARDLGTFTSLFSPLARWQSARGDRNSGATLPLADLGQW